jgi:nitrite reductase/ring-hydroxylating ferredoxin subunit
VLHYSPLVQDSSPPALYSGALPTPSGWYCLGAAGDFPRRVVRTKRIAGREIVVFRTDDGRVAVLDAYCPHLGAHLGRGGRVEADSIRCPFHGFTFDGRGACTKTGYGTKPPPHTRARAYPVRELDGLVLVYVHARSDEPTWAPEPADMRGWSPFRLHMWTLRGHPQETTENSVDFGHFGVVHGYEDVHQRATTELLGPHLFARYGFKRPSLRLVGKTWSVREEIDVHVWGLGYSRVEVRDLTLGLDIRLLVLPTPIEAERIEFRIGLSLRHFRDSPRVPESLRRIPPAVASAVLVPALLAVYRRDVAKDFPIWEAKRYVDPPALASGDGPVGLYRRWVRQFYEDRSSRDGSRET